MITIEHIKGYQAEWERGSLVEFALYGSNTNTRESNVSATQDKIQIDSITSNTF